MVKKRVTPQPVINPALARQMEAFQWLKTVGRGRTSAKVHAMLIMGMLGNATSTLDRISAELKAGDEGLARIRERVARIGL